MSWVSSLCTTSDAELISMASGLSFRNRPWCDQALGVWGLILFWGAMHFLAYLGLLCGWRSPCETSTREMNHLNASISSQALSAL